MISQLGLRISTVFRRTAPDPFVLAIMLTVLTAAIALALGYPARPLADRPLLLLEAWGPGLWNLLPFAMQMCLILVTGHALAASRPVRALIDRAAAVPRNTAQAAMMISLLACAAATINWGLGLIVGALLAREVGLSLSRRGITAHYPLLAAAGYTGLMVWHGGLSGSAPLSMTTRENAARALPADLVGELAQRFGEGTWLGLEQTLGSTSNLIITGGLVLLVPAVMGLMAPKDTSAMQGVEAFLSPASPAPARTAHPPTHAREPIASESEHPGTVPEWLERTPAAAWLLALLLLIAFGWYWMVRGPTAIGLNEINTVMIALGLFLHGSARSYAAAVEDGARGCAGIIIQFPLYAGIMAMMSSSGLIHIFSRWLLSIGTPETIPLLSFASAGIVNFFVPSGGGQWAVQGPIAIRAGLDAGVDPAKMVMSVAYGDQLTNMLQPFWALPLLAITGVRARDIVGYTALAMVAGALWIAFWLVIL
jgi:short-chain fatty acids transporter